MPQNNSPRQASKFVAQPGTVFKRKEIHQRYGGIQFTGISYSSFASQNAEVISPNIFIFSDAKSGGSFGYDLYDGLQPDGSYFYTGEGQTEDQVFTRGNLAIRDSAKSGRFLHIFEAKSPYATYLGEFRYSSATLREAPDKNGDKRLVIVFHLVPVGETDIDEANTSEAQQDQDPVRACVDIKDYAPRSGKKYKRNTLAVALESDPAEARLEADFHAWWKKQGIEPKDLKIKLSGGGTVEPDLFIPEMNLVVEAKASTSTESIRMALGQILDYVFTLNHASDFVGQQNQGQAVYPAVLLPTEPNMRSLRLLSAHHVTVYWPEDQDKGFVEYRPGQNSR